MHFLQHLLRVWLPIAVWKDEQSPLPPGTSYVINYQDKFVVTSSGANVIAKHS